MNEGKLTKICIVGVVLSMAALYFVIIQIYSVHVKIGEINKEWVGKNVNITGSISDLRISKGHMFFNLKDETGKIKVVVWNNTLELLYLNGVNISEIKDGKSVNVIGNVQIFRGELEIIPIREQVKIIS
jgi:exonuclease VII large subunit